jgi:hypothetical protein
VCITGSLICASNFSSILAARTLISFKDSCIPLIAFHCERSSLSATIFPFAVFYLFFSLPTSQPSFALAMHRKRLPVALSVTYTYTLTGFAIYAF